MKEKTVDLALLQKAQQGHKESLSALAELARSDVFVYLHRLTLDGHMAEDLCQETLVLMLESLPKLRVPTVQAFWAWMYRTAFSRVSHQFRDQGKSRLQNHITADTRMLSEVAALEPSAPQALIRKELTTAIYEAMDSIKLKYRNILTLRCFQNLSYAEIAVTTGGTELQARLLFFRATRCLRHQLASRGFKKKEHLLPALSIFAALTAGHPKAVSAASLVKAATLEVSAGTFVLGMATTKVGIAVIVTTAACIIGGTVGLDAFPSNRDAPRAVPERVENIDTTLLDLLQSPDFARPFAIGKSNGKGFLWTDRSSTGPTQSGANLGELLLNKSEQDLRAVVLPTGRWVDVRFQRPIVDGPGADIIIAGWTGPGPALEVFGAKGPGMPLPNPTQLRDTQDRIVLGYDLAQLPQAVPVRTVRIAGTHNQGPHQGFELHEIRARLQ